MPHIYRHKQWEGDSLIEQLTSVAGHHHVKVEKDIDLNYVAFPDGPVTAELISFGSQCYEVTTQNFMIVWSATIDVNETITDQTFLSKVGNNIGAGLNYGGGGVCTIGCAMMAWAGAASLGIVDAPVTAPTAGVGAIVAGVGTAAWWLGGCIQTWCVETVTHNHKIENKSGHTDCNVIEIAPVKCPEGDLIRGTLPKTHSVDDCIAEILASL